MSVLAQNDLGKIDVNDGVIAKIAGLTATDCMGVLGLASAESWTDMLRKDSVDRGVRVSQLENSTLKIEVNIVAKYGVAIVAVAKNIIQSVTYQVERMTGLTVDSVDVCVRSIRV